MLNEAFARMPKVFEHNILVGGQDCYQRGQVLNARLSDGLLKGRVKGKTNQIYDVYMDLKTWPNSPSNCTCPYRSNCQHAAACLFMLKDKESVSRVQKTADSLDKKLDSWLKNLQAEAVNLKTTQDSSQQLIYLLAPRIQAHGHDIAVKLALAKVLKRGGLGKKIPFTTITPSRKQYFTEADETIVAQLMFKCGVGGWFDTLFIRNSALLEKMLASGRAYFIDNEDKLMRLGAACTPLCEWELCANGEQRFVLKNQDKYIQPLLLDETWYFDTVQYTLGKLDTPFPPNQLQSLLEAPPIALEQAQLLAKKMAVNCPEFPQPQIFSEREILEIDPIPVVFFDSVEIQSSYPWEANIPALTRFTLTLAFNYAGVKIPYFDASKRVVKKQEQILQEYQRNKAIEDHCMMILEQHLSLRSADEFEQKHSKTDLSLALIVNDLDSTDDLAFLYEKVIPELKNAGWQIEFRSDLYEEQVNADDVEWFSDLEESDNDFFSYQLGILVEGKQVSIVPLVADLINQYRGSNLDAVPDEQKVKLPLEDGRVLLLELGRIKPLVRLLLQYGQHRLKNEDFLKISRYQLLLMQEAELAMAATKARWQGGDSLRGLLQQLTKLESLPTIPAPQGLNAQLRDYQQQGVEWLQFLRMSRFSGILADDMGLGKTVQTLAHLLYEKEQGRLSKASLIIAPTSLVGNWLAEAKRFTADLRVLVFHGSERHDDNFDDYDLIVSTYGLIQRDKIRFLNYEFYYLILDEAQFIKNSRTKTTQIIQQLRASHRLCLSGTPLENHLGELWSLFNFLMPGLLGDAKQFRQWFRTPIEKNADIERQKLLAKRVRPFMLRRTKNEVANELPAKTEILRTIEIVDEQRDLYEAIRMSMEKKVRDAIAKQGLGKSHILLLDALLKLRQICCDPRLLSLPEAKIAHKSSAKLDALMELLDNLIEEGRRVLVFSQFTSMLKLIEEQLVDRKYAYLKLTGQTQNRQDLVDNFQQNDIPIFLISLKAGGTGLNLTKADTVIHYDPWWNPAVEDQATDRSHRIGQENPVFVYKLITEGTVEEAILKMQGKKRQLAEGILSSNRENTIMLTESDIDEFFMPL